MISVYISPCFLLFEMVQVTWKPCL